MRELDAHKPPNQRWTSFLHFFGKKLGVLFSFFFGKKLGVLFSFFFLFSANKKGFLCALRGSLLFRAFHDALEDGESTITSCHHLLKIRCPDHRRYALRAIPDASADNTIRSGRRHRAEKPSHPAQCQSMPRCSDH